MSDLFNPFATTPPASLREVADVGVRRMGGVEAPRLTADGRLVLRVEGGPQDRATWLSANDRVHWAVKARITKAWRDAARKAATAADVKALGWQRVKVVAWLHFADDLRRDASNYQPTLKAAVDGLVDAGLCPDDDRRHLDGPDARTGEPTGRTRPGHPQKAAVTFVITDLGTPLPRRTR